MDVGIMDYTKETRELKSSTGYIKHIESGVVYPNSSIFLGKYDKEENYEEANKKDYEEYLLKLKEEEKDNGSDGNQTIEIGD